MPRRKGSNVLDGCPKGLRGMPQTGPVQVATRFLVAASRAGAALYAVGDEPPWFRVREDDRGSEEAIGQCGVLWVSRQPPVKGSNPGRD